MSLIHISNLTFGYDGCFDSVFEGVSVQLDTDWRLGLTGSNGRGKTTLLRLLMNQYIYQGTISASVEFGYFPFLVTDPDLNGLTIAQQMNPELLQWQLERELSLLELDSGVLWRPFCTLSSGEQTKLLLAILFLKENCFLLIDEPTNHLDAHARQVVSDYLCKKNGFILVSHDRTVLDRCVDHILSINRANVEVQRGNFSSWWENKQRQDSFELAKNDRLRGDIGRLHEAAKRTSSWSDKVEKTKYATYNSGLRPDRGYVGHKSAKMMKRAKSIQQRQQAAIEEKSTLLKNLEEVESLKIATLVHHKRVLARLIDITVDYGNGPVCQEINCTIERGDRVALCGRNGSGKSSILKLLLGQEISHSGQIEVASGLMISYVSQETAFLKGSLEDFEEERQLDASLFRAILRKLDFARAQFEKPVEDYSGGQKKKLLLAASLAKPAHLYIWDEPLNFMDVFSRMQLEQMLEEHHPTMLFVEHDAAFCIGVATKLIDLSAQ